MTTYPNISKVKNTSLRVVISNSLLGVWDYNQTPEALIDHISKHLNSLLGVWDCDLTLPYYLKSSKVTANLLFLRKENTGSTPANPKAYSLFAFTTKNIKIK